MRVEADGLGVAPVTRFQTMTAEQYFEPYLGSSTATGSAPPDAAPAAASESGAAAPSPAPPATGGNQ
jgi:hypothetical protein